MIERRGIWLEGYAERDPLRYLSTTQGFWPLESRRRIGELDERYERWIRSSEDDEAKKLLLADALDVDDVWGDPLSPSLRLVHVAYDSGLLSSAQPDTHDLLENRLLRFVVAPLKGGPAVTIFRPISWLLVAARAHSSGLSELETRAKSVSRALMSRDIARLTAALESEVRGGCTCLAHRETLGDVAWARGDLKEAEYYYRGALEAVPPGMLVPTRDRLALLLGIVRAARGEPIDEQLAILRPGPSPAAKYLAMHAFGKARAAGRLGEAARLKRLLSQLAAEDRDYAGWAIALFMLQGAVAQEQAEEAFEDLSPVVQELAESALAVQPGAARVLAALLLSRHCFSARLFDRVFGATHTASLAAQYACVLDTRVRSGEHEARVQASAAIRSLGTPSVGLGEFGLQKALLLSELAEEAGLVDEAATFARIATSMLGEGPVPSHMWTLVRNSALRRWFGLIGTGATDTARQFGAHWEARLHASRPAAQESFCDAALGLVSSELLFVGQQGIVAFEAVCPATRLTGQRRVALHAMRAVSAGDLTRAYGLAGNWFMVPEARQVAELRRSGDAEGATALVRAQLTHYQRTFGPDSGRCLWARDFSNVATDVEFESLLHDTARACPPDASCPAAMALLTKRFSERLNNHPFRTEAGEVLQVAERACRDYWEDAPAWLRPNVRLALFEIPLLGATRLMLGDAAYRTRLLRVTREAVEEAGSALMASSQSLGFIKALGTIEPAELLEGDSDAAAAAYPIVARTKGLYTDALRRAAQARSRLVRLGRSQSLADYDRVVARLRIESVGNTPDRELIQELLAAKADAEARWRAEFPDLASDPVGSDATVVSVPIPVGHAVVDFYFVSPTLLDRRHSNGQLSRHRLLAVVLPTPTGARVVDLGDAETILQAVRDWRSAVLEHEAAIEQWAELERKLWTPVLKVLPQPVRRVWVIPDGELARLPWQLFESTAGPSVGLVDSLRDLAIVLRVSERPGGNAIVLGAPSYGQGPDGSRTYADLPGTLEEIDQVAGLARTSGMDVVTLTGNDATKSRLIKATDSPRVLHIATHGFFAGPRRTVTGLSRGPDVLGAAVSALLSDATPLLEAGLALAGANDPANPDGVVTAEELLATTLMNTELVTLSACETARGTEIVGEGVIGLRSAVIAAGARSLLMSLWKIPDDATRLLMGDFYRGLWVDGLSKAAALRRAQATVRSHKAGVYSAPYYWAGWVLAGVAD